MEGKKREVRQAGKQGFSHCCLRQSELSVAAKQTVVWPGEEKQAGCGMPLGGVKIYNKERPLKKRKILFLKNSAEA